MSDDANIFNDNSHEENDSAAIIVMPMDDYPHSKTAICESAYSVSKFRHEHPNIYSEYLNASNIVGHGEEEIFHMDSEFPYNPTNLELTEGFKTDELMFEIDEDNLGVIGIAIYAVNGSVFRFYLSQLMSLELFILHYAQEHYNGNIPEGYSLGELN